MSLDAETLLDRRRLKRRVFFWRTAAFLAVAAALIAGYAATREDGGILGGRDRVARVSISGFIGTDRKFVDLFDRLGRDNHVKGVIVQLDTPGGSTAGGEAIYEALRSLAAKKPTVARMEALAASAGYMIALGADHIVSRRNTLTGSIGVIIQWPDASRLLDTVGVKYEDVKSSPMKAEPTPFRPASPESRAMLEKTVRDSYEWFVALVAERRGLAPEVARDLADGRVVTGAMARDLKLVDTLGGEAAALDWLATKGVDRKLKVVDADPRDTSSWGGLLGEETAAVVARGVLRTVGLGWVESDDGRVRGLVSAWRP
jgi:protease-4